MNFRKKRFLQWVGVLMLCAWLSGCATVRKPSVDLPSLPGKPVQTKGVYHKVNKGETLWRISKTYKISVEDIIQANRIPSAASIEENQLLLIPGADTVKDVIPPQAPGGKDTDYWWPLKGRIVSYFEDRKGAHINLGVDIKGAENDAVKAAREGRVVFADHLAGYGTTVMIDHGDGFASTYGYNQDLWVKEGDRVSGGQKIASVGRPSRGSNSRLFFQIRRNGIPVDPLKFVQ